ncbi:hypothetical protein RO3G_15380 [Rhizopus delemar RA 99-880]|uniref:Uncharacterized protein n=1 Tax=Rhizopus delemar (strain RA 99-880 / ATCC MYA-4621 / FGSC 9543 / NRRL 43880) TaxID=246409 RepID=I1CQD9_RHIO9|nr:hypothetical protein RO3G_15380 [Rhizopus delemar RA 99-880]|eukprot:EIE90669.1 hypothetical protein RO3G_15380 [Rhizopus delemar RA 99-880]
MFRNARFIKLSVRYSSTLTNQKVWVVTDGGIENTLQAMALGKRLAGSNQLSENLKLKTIVSSKKLQMFPTIIQKYIVDYNKNTASGQNTVSACLHLSKVAKNSFSVYVGYPNIPFINFNQVILPKYEANAKMAALGPLAKQKNGIITPAPLLDVTPNVTDHQKGYSAVIVGGHSRDCKWYSEDALLLADNVKRMVQRFGDEVTIVFTDRTPDLVKEKMSKRLEGQESIKIWDSTKEQKTAEKIKNYEDIIIHSQRVILTADLDYATAHAISKK